MSEEKRKGEIQKPKVISRIARIAGFVTFSLSLLMVLYSCYYAFAKHSEQDIGLVIMVVPTLLLFGIIAAISLILSIGTLFIEQDKRRQLQPLAFVLAGILLLAISFFIVGLP